jgi:gluconokinase
MNVMLGIDIGTTSTKGLLCRTNGQIVAQFNHSYPLQQTVAGTAEENPQAILMAVTSGLQAILRTVHQQQLTLAGLSFSSANQSLIALDNLHRPLTNLLTWVDTRAAPAAAKLKKSDFADELYQRTGTPLHPMSLLAKLIWLKTSQPKIFKQATYFCGIKEYILWKLFGKWQMDISIASGTGLFNWQQQNWDPEILAIAGIQESQLPPIVDSYTTFSKMRPDLAAKLNWPQATPIVQGAFDGALANLGVNALDSKTAALSIGTSAAIRLLSKQPALDPQGRLFCYAVSQQQWVIGGPVNNGGIVLRWALEKLFTNEKISWEKAGADSYEQLLQIIQTIPAGANGLLFFPFLNGERAPLWDADIRASFIGLTQTHSRAEMARAAVEGIIFNLRSVWEIFSNHTFSQPKQLVLSGGFAKSPFLRQLIADIFNCPVQVPAQIEASCLGAILLGMDALGLTDNLAQSAAALSGTVTTYQPNPAAAKSYNELFTIYQRLQDHLGHETTALTAWQRKFN